MVVAGRGRDDAVAQADVGRALAGRGEEHLRRRRVRVLLEEVVLHLPHRVEAQPVGQLDLLERLVDDAVLLATFPRTRKLVLVEDAELHGVPPRSAPDMCMAGSRGVAWRWLVR